jgi:hypothetical protein
VVQALLQVLVQGLALLLCCQWVEQVQWHCLWRSLLGLLLWYCPLLWCCLVLWCLWLEV